jgi:hypothetical protein
MLDVYYVDWIGSLYDLGVLNVKCKHSDFVLSFEFTITNDLPIIR